MEKNTWKDIQSNTRSDIQKKNLIYKYRENHKDKHTAMNTRSDIYRMKGVPLGKKIVL